MPPQIPFHSMRIQESMKCFDDRKQSQALKSHRPGSNTWLMLTSCASLGKLLDPSEPTFLL